MRTLSQGIVVFAGLLSAPLALDMPAKPVFSGPLADPRLEPGECRVKAGDHEVDAGCQGRLAACMEQVRDALSAEDREEAA